MTRNRQHAYVDLNPDQRSLLLAEIQQWIDAERAATPGVAKP
jgi:hypothetical protein